MVTPAERMKDANFVQAVALGAKEIAKDPIAMRSVFNSVANIINFTAIFTDIGRAGTTVITTFKTAQKSIRFLQIGNTIEKWAFFKYQDPLTTTANVADTIITVASIPQFFDSLNIINLTSFCKWFRAIPVIGFVAVLPIVPILLALEIFVNVVEGLKEAKDLHHLISGKFKSDATAKVNKYINAQQAILNGQDPATLINQKHRKNLQGLNAEEIKITVQADQHRRIEKWRSKIDTLKNRKKQRMLNIAFRISASTLNLLLGVAVYATSPIIPVALIICGLSMSVTGLSKFFHGHFKPMHQSITFQAIRLPQS